MCALVVLLSAVCVGSTRFCLRLHLNLRLTRLLLQERAQLQAGGFEPEVVLSAVSSAHEEALASIKNRPIGYIAAKVCCFVVCVGVCAGREDGEL